jgi:hypothetical protein
MNLKKRCCYKKQVTEKFIQYMPICIKGNWIKLGINSYAENYFKNKNRAGRMAQAVKHLPRQA